MKALKLFLAAAALVSFVATADAKSSLKECMANGSSQGFSTAQAKSYCCPRFPKAKKYKEICG